MREAASDRTNEWRAMWGLPPFGSECDYVGCHNPETVATMGKFRLCAEHVKPHYHPPKTKSTLDAVAAVTGNSEHDA